MPRRQPNFPRKAEPAGILLEAVLATAIVGIALSFIVPEMFARQLELSRRTRDTNLVEAAVNRDINAYRQWARIFRLRRGPYSDKYIPSSSWSYDSINGALAVYNVSTAGGFREGVCGKMRDFVLESLDDIPVANFNPDFAKNSTKIPLPKQLEGRYTLTRSYDFSRTTTDVMTYRINYKLEPNPGATSKIEPLAFQRSAEIQIEAVNAC